MEAFQGGLLSLGKYVLSNRRVSACLPFPAAGWIAADWLTHRAMSQTQPVRFQRLARSRGACMSPTYDDVIDAVLRMIAVHRELLAADRAFEAWLRNEAEV